MRMPSRREVIPWYCLQKHAELKRNPFVPLLDQVCSYIDKCIDGLEEDLFFSCSSSLFLGGVSIVMCLVCSSRSLYS